jgi:3-deoxy-7-phosphoheptulonate synthase
MKLHDTHITAYHAIVSPSELKKQIPLCAQGEKTVNDARRAIMEILDGESAKRLMIVGPCSINDVAAAKEYASRLRSLQEQVKGTCVLVMRVYFEKPRTTVGWKGFINDPHLNDTFEMEEGLTLARTLLADLAEMGVPTATEALDPMSIQYFADTIAWASIGARTTESQTHREMASGLSMPVGFKNSTQGSVDVAVNAMKSAQSEHTFLGIDQTGKLSIVDTAGNPYGHVILRGGEKPNYDNESVAAAIERLRKAGLREKLVIDCSHANSSKDYKRQPLVFRDVLAQMQENPSIIGMMVESYLVEGNQAVTEKPLTYGLSVTDACISWESTEELLLEAHAALNK